MRSHAMARSRVSPFNAPAMRGSKNKSARFSPPRVPFGQHHQSARKLADAEHHVFERRHAGEQAHVLKRTHHALTRNHVRRKAADVLAVKSDRCRRQPAKRR